MRVLQGEHVERLGRLQVPEVALHSSEPFPSVGLRVAVSDVPCALNDSLESVAGRLHLAQHVLHVADVVHRSELRLWLLEHPPTPERSGEFAHCVRKPPLVEECGAHAVVRLRRTVLVGQALEALCRSLEALLGGRELAALPESDRLLEIDLGEDRCIVR